MKHERRARTLELAMGCLAPSAPGKGLCFHWSAALVIDMPGSELCIGTMHGDIIHAWVERDGKVYVPTLVERMGALVPIDRAYYYRVNAVEDVKRLTRRQIVSVGAYRHLTTGEPLGPGRALGDELMAMAGVAFRTTSEGTAKAAK